MVLVAVPSSFTTHVFNIKTSVNYIPKYAFPIRVLTTHYSPVSGSDGVGSGAHGHGSEHGLQELRHGAFLETGINGDGTDVTLISKEDSGCHQEQIRPIVRTRLDMARLVRVFACCWK